MRFLRIICTLLACVGIGQLTAEPAAATPTYFAGVDFGGNQTSDTLAIASYEETTTSTDLYTGALNVSKKVGSAVSSGGGASVSSATFISWPDGQQLLSANLGIGADAILTFSDLVVSGPVPGVQVQTALHLRAAGNVVTTLNFNATDGASASGHVSVDVNAAGTVFEGDIDVMNHQNPVLNHYTTTGLLTGFSGNGDLTTPSFFVTTGVPFFVELRVGVETGSFAHIGGSSANNHYIVFSDAGASGAIGFSPNGPVFSLPPGFTADSPDAGIVDNQFIPTPEPASWVLMVIGFAAIAGGRKRKRATKLVPGRSPTFKGMASSQ